MDPSTGTFTSMDTYAGSLSDPMSLHKYLFANSNPVMYSDPSGHYSLAEECAVMGCIGAIVGALSYTIDAFVNDPEMKSHSISGLFKTVLCYAVIAIAVVLIIHFFELIILLFFAKPEVAQEFVNDVKENSETIWDNVHGTAERMSATEIPATFQVKLNDTIQYINPNTGTNVLWTNANATEHMGEYVGRFGPDSSSILIRSQLMLESYYAALNQAMESLSKMPPGEYFGVYGNWELGINTINGVVYHARMLR